MTHEQQALWQRIRDFQIDAPDASFPYSSRLAREQGWTPVYTARVIDEYRRFAFLSVVAGHGVTPSKAVDEAWHLHLLYTRNYWDGFCAQALGRPLHHNPSGGTSEDESKYEGWYENTLTSYRRLFGEEPPADIWNPVASPGEGRLRFRWPFVGLFALVLVGCDESANPLDWHGPAFLGLFALVYALGLLIAYVVRQALGGPTEGPPAEDWRLHVYDQAYLNGGPSLALSTALAHLTALKVIEVEPKTRRIRATGLSLTTDHPLDRAILRATDSPTGAKYESILNRSRSTLAEMEGSLRRQGLWSRPDDLGPALLLPFAIASLPLILGVVKIFIGLSRERPVGFLVVGCVLGFLLNLALLSPPKRSRYGERVLSELRGQRPDSHRTRLDPGELAAGMALFGLAALDGGEYAYLRPAIVPPATTGGGGDGGGSSCGGGCGGGCGGCGS